MLYIKHIILLLFNCRCDSFVFRLPPTLIIQKVLFVCLYHIISVAIVASHCCCCYFIVHTFQISRFPASRFRFSQLSFVLQKYNLSLFFFASLSLLPHQHKRFSSAFKKIKIHSIVLNPHIAFSAIDGMPILQKIFFFFWFFPHKYNIYSSQFPLAGFLSSNSLHPELFLIHIFNQLL